MPLRPRFVTFDCHGTLIDFQLARVTREVLGDRLGAEQAPGFLRAFSAYRLDEAMGGWKPYREGAGRPRSCTSRRAFATT